MFTPRRAVTAHQLSDKDKPNLLGEEIKELREGLSQLQSSVFQSLYDKKVQGNGNDKNSTSSSIAANTNTNTNTTSSSVATSSSGKDSTISTSTSVPTGSAKPEDKSVNMFDASKKVDTTSAVKEVAKEETKVKLEASTTPDSKPKVPPVAAPTKPSNLFSETKPGIREKKEDAVVLNKVPITSAQETEEGSGSEVAKAQQAVSKSFISMGDKVYSCNVFRRSLMIV